MAWTKHIPCAYSAASARWRKARRPSCGALCRVRTLHRDSRRITGRTDRSDSDDPEVELTAIVIAGLARVWALATYTQVQRVSSLAALERAVRADVTRAAHLAAPTLDAFDDLYSRP